MHDLPQEAHMKTLAFLVLAGLLPSLAFAQIQTSIVEYSDRSTPLEGYLAFKKGISGKQPGVLVVHDWMGLNQHYREVAEKLAELGYVAFSADIYGKGVRPKDSTGAAEEANKYKSDRGLMRQRVKVALEELKKNSHVDPARVAAIGYCFGGTVVLELARSGADISGVVTFHGGLDTPTPEDAKNIKAKVLALHGADDPFVPPQQAAAFQDEMRKGGVDWQMIYFGNAVHSFTIPVAGNDKAKGSAYNEKADKRSWEAMKSFFKEIFAAPTGG
jgi:dienelactone hydrolase